MKAAAIFIRLYRYEHLPFDKER